MASVEAKINSKSSSGVAVPRFNQFGVGNALGAIGIHAILLTYSLIAMFPIVLTVINSFKKQGDIFGQPYTIPLGSMFSLLGYQTVFKRAEALTYLQNSLIVTGGSVIVTLIFGSMAAFAISEYKFRGNALLALYMALGIMLPIRLGTVSIIRLSTALGLTGTLQGLICVYVAQNLPLAIFILSQFLSEVPIDLKDAARIDGASEYRIFGLVIPLIRQAMFSVTVFAMIPIWNDLWFPLIMAPRDETKTITLGIQTFTGQYGTNWPALLAALTLAMLPVIIIYIVFSRQLIKGLMSGAVKG
ncbi:MAG: carbohydrate ABC transporter permease [Chloroflexota bacterium]